MTDKSTVEVPAEIQSMQDGVFNVVISLCQVYSKYGFTQEESRESAAILLESIAATLRTITKDEKQKQ